MNNRLDHVMTRQKMHLLRDSALALLLFAGMTLAVVAVLFSMPPVVPAGTVAPAPVIAELEPATAAGISTDALLAPTP
jgi:hypothetical protein